MFCFQCEQTANGKGCCGKAGVCGKVNTTADLQDDLIGALIGLAGTANRTDGTDEAIINGLFATITNVNFDNDDLNAMIKNVHDLGGKNDYNMKQVWEGNEDIRSLKSLILFGIKGIAAYAYHAHNLGYKDKAVIDFLYRSLAAIGQDLDADKLLPLVLETGEVNLKCMELLDRANTETYGVPTPTIVPLKVEKGPFIVVSGHDLHDLHQLLKQTEGKGVNVYTHGEMLPCHAYPQLKKYAHLKGNFGTAWQNQQKEFDGVPAAFLFTTNCLMPPKDSYRDRVFTTAVVGYDGLKHVDSKDFSPVIEKAIELGGYSEDRKMTGINGGETMTTGFGHGVVLSLADKVVDAVKSGAIKHFYLVGGCDGARPGRNYYTDFVKKTPKDSIILTLACGKYRFNDLNLGNIDDFPRIMDMGQCNDSFSAITVAAALAQAFDCGLNELPLTLVLSWYEQKAVAVLLSLLHLGMKNILIGPSLPAFISPNVLDILVKNYSLTPISTPEEDLRRING